MLGNLAFRLMSLEYRWRDLRRPPRNLLDSAGIRPGMTVLDFGCGPGSFSAAAAELVGREGHVLAVDIHPLALQSVQRRARRLGLAWLEAVPAQNLDAVGSDSVDVVLLFDVLHELGNAPWVFPALRRVLHGSGSLRAADHHMSQSEVVAQVTRGTGFRLAGQDGTVLRFVLGAQGGA